MALKRIKSGWQIYVYDPATKTKKYRGVRAKWSDAKDLERTLLSEQKGTAKPGTLTIREYAAQWLEHHHGQGTRRPALTSRQVNESNLRRFLNDYGDQALDSITRREALRWSKLDGNQHRAKTVSAMFNDAVDDEEVTANPFANRRVKEQRGRRDIHPLTEEEVNRLADIALERWGPEGYGLIVRAAVLFAAWVGTRPGETFSVTWADLNLRDGLVTVHRIKGRQQTDTLVLPSVVADAIRAMPSPSGALVFPTIRGKHVEKGSLRYIWEPVRSAFRQTVSRERWDELCEGQPDLDFYVCRHFCASVIVERGGNEFDVAAQLGNTVEVCRETYIHSYADSQRERLRGLLERPHVVDLSAARERRIGGDK
jgi:integrase